MKYICAIWVTLLISSSLWSQEGSHYHESYSHARVNEEDTSSQRDALDIWYGLLHKTKPRSVLQYKHPLYSVLPGMYYNTANGFALTLSANLVYYASADRSENLSTLYGLGAYGSHQQSTLWLASNLWTAGNHYNLPGNFWLLKYTETTYGLGGHSTSTKREAVDYNYLRVHEAILKNITGSLMAGVGYQLDYHYNIHDKSDENLLPVEQAPYGNKNASTSSGPSVQVLFDTRHNSINPYHGTYATVVFSPKFRFLGSDESWQSLLIDIRKYVPTSAYNHNVLAFWGMGWFTLSGMPPYFDLPSTQWDDLQRTARGYVQGRYRGRNMLYAEGEYRFRITANELFGAVVFCNAQSFTDGNSSRFTTVLPAAGAGIRIKLNKYSRTNLCLDYAVGVNGSRTLFFNLGEIF